MKDFYNLADLSSEKVEGTARRRCSIQRTSDIHRAWRANSSRLLFLAPSLRTRCSFEVGIRQMGGGVSTLEGSMFYGLETRDGVRMDGDTAEHIKEAVPVLSRFYSGLGLRVMAGGESLRRGSG